MTAAPPTTSDLVLAFRQAKRAFATERMMVGLADFARFELELDQRLRDLRRRLRDERWFTEVDVGRVVVVPRSVEQAAATTQDVIRVGKSEGRPHLSGATIRLQLAPTPEFATVEVLYLWTFGPALESLLDTTCVGYRLKRVAQRGKMDRHALDVYEHWPSAFARYRDDPISLARDILSERNGRVLITSTDVASFFDTVDPSFLLDPHFVRRVSDAARQRGRPFVAVRYRQATQTLLEAFARFRRERAHFRATTIDGESGVPIGALTSRLVANVALAPLDTYVQTRSKVVLYRRYVDDIVIVRRVDDADDVPSTKTAALSDLFPQLTHQGREWTFGVPETGARFRLKESKTLVHDLDGTAGREFLGSIGQSFALVSSERRALLANIDRLEAELDAIDLFDGSAARTDHLPRLRDADRFTLRRFMATAYVRAIERSAFVLEPGSAQRLVDERARRILAALDSAEPFENLEIVLSLLRIALMLGHDTLRRRLDRWLTDENESLGDIERVMWRGEQLRVGPTITGLKRYLRERRTEAIASAASYYTESHPRTRSAARLLRHADLRHFDREDDAAMFGNPPPIPASAQRGFDKVRARLQNGVTRQRLDVIMRFLRTHAAGTDDPWRRLHPMSVLLSARPPRYSDVARRVLAGAEATRVELNDTGTLLAKMVDAVRGTRYARRPSAVSLRRDARGVTLMLSADQPETLRVMVANLPVEPADFEAAARGTPRLTRRRMRALDDALREARYATNEARRDGIPTILIFPELAIPRRLERLLVRHAADEGISLVAGLEYRHLPAGVRNEAIGLFPRGLKRVYPVTWTKRHPAQGEASSLAKLGVAFAGAAGSGRFVVESQHGRIAVLVCSEILEASALANLTGRIELLAVPAWNVDTGTFEHVAHAAASMLVHTFVAVANNAESSDSRVVSPVSEPRHLREWARIIHRGHSRVIWGDLPIGALREMHDGAAAPLSAPVTFRPLPPGWR
jgi:hypothetical protein